MIVFWFVVTALVSGSFGYFLAAIIISGRGESKSSARSTVVIRVVASALKESFHIYVGQTKIAHPCSSDLGVLNIHAQAYFTVLAELGQKQGFRVVRQSRKDTNYSFEEIWRVENRG